MPTSCIAGCSLPAADVDEAGLRLGLCIRHLRALRGMCKGKQSLAYAKLAVREAARLVATGATHRPGRTPTAYRCHLCPGAWHVGHQEIGGDGRPADAAAAAAAVRDRLTSGQLDHLCIAWRPGIARRPARRSRQGTVPKQ